MLLISLGAIRPAGLNLGIDFKEETQVAFETPRPVALEAVRSQAGKIGQANAQIQVAGRSAAVRRVVPQLHGANGVAHDD